MGKVFQYPLAKDIQQAPKWNESNPVKVEVDIIANGGNAWISIRSVKIVDLSNFHWTGLPSRHKASTKMTSRRSKLGIGS